MPRLVGSFSSMICMARGFGAPDNVPAGNTANNASIGAIDCANFPFTVETICITCEYFSICMNCVTSTEPALQTRPKSFLPKSTSIKCSARSFGSLSNSFAIVSSSSGVPPLGLVPAIGWMTTSRPVTFTNASGLEPTIDKSSLKRNRYIYGLGFCSRKTRYKSNGSESAGILNRCESTTWNASPDLISSLITFTLSI